MCPAPRLTRIIGLVTLRRQWAVEEVLKLERITEDMALYTPLLRYASSEPDLPHFFTLLASIYSMAQADASQVFMVVFGAALEILKRSALKGAAAKAGRKTVKEHIKLFYRFLSAGHNAVVAPTLDLLTTIAGLDGSVNELLFGSFDFSLKPLPKFAFMRKKMLAQGERRDIRTAYVMYIMSFVEHGNHATKLALAKMQNLVGPVFAGLEEDRPALVRHVLQALTDNVVYNEKRSKALSIAFLYSSSLTKVAKLYEADDAEVVEAADAFLRLVATNSDCGLCFRVQETEPRAEAASVKNKILLDFLLSLNPLEGLKKQQLCLDILQACPDVFGAYWSRSSFSFEPEASARFINLAAFAVKAMASVPVSLAGDLDASSVLPKGANAAGLLRGVSHANALVAFSASLLLRALVGRAEVLVQELEWHLVRLDSPSAVLFAKRNELLEQLNARIPSAKALQQVFSQMLQKSAGDKTVLVASNILATLESYSRLFALLPEYVPATIKVAPSNIPAFWSYIVETLPFAYSEAAPVIQALSSVDLVWQLTRNAALRSGFVAPSDLGLIQRQFFSLEASQPVSPTFPPEVLQRVSPTFPPEVLQQVSPTFPPEATLTPSLEASKQMARTVFAALARLQKGRFSTSMAPLLADLGITRHASPPWIPLDLGHLQRSAFSAKDEVDLEQVTVPDLTGTAMSGLVDEILGLVKRDLVSRAVVSSTFDTTKALAESNTEITRQLLGGYEYFSWLQFLAKIFTESDIKLDLRLVLETGVLAFAIHSLASPNEHVWRAGHFVLNAFYRLLEDAKFRERREIFLAFDCLRNSLQEDTRISAVLAAFVCESIQVLLRPGHWMYARVMEFLLGNHSFDLKKIPLIVECLCSSSENMGRDQAWMLRVLSSGLRPGTDYGEVYHFNHVVPSIQVLLQLPHLDGEAERLSRKVLATIISGPMKRELVDGQGFGTWVRCLPAKRAYIADELNCHIVDMQ